MSTIFNYYSVLISSLVLHAFILLMSFISLSCMLLYYVTVMIAHAKKNVRPFPLNKKGNIGTMVVACTTAH